MGEKGRNSAPRERQDIFTFSGPLGFGFKTFIWEDIFAQPGARRCEGCRISSAIVSQPNLLFPTLGCCIPEIFMTLVCTICSKVLQVIGVTETGQ